MCDVINGRPLLGAVDVKIADLNVVDAVTTGATMLTIDDLRRRGVTPSVLLERSRKFSVTHVL